MADRKRRHRARLRAMRLAGTAGPPGDGIRLFDDPALTAIKLEQTRAVEAPGVTHLYYRIV